MLIPWPFDALEFLNVHDLSRWSPALRGCSPFVVMYLLRLSVGMAVSVLDFALLVRGCALSLLWRKMYCLGHSTCLIVCVYLACAGGRRRDVVDCLL